MSPVEFFLVLLLVVLVWKLAIMYGGCNSDEIMFLRQKINKLTESPL